jgi:hypothetical protein
MNHDTGLGEPIVRSDVGVAGSNPVTPTIDFPSYFTSDYALGVSFTSCGPHFFDRDGRCPREADTAS